MYKFIQIVFFIVLTITPALLPAHNEYWTTTSEQVTGNLTETTDPSIALKWHGSTPINLTIHSGNVPQDIIEEEPNKDAVKAADLVKSIMQTAYQTWEGVGPNCVDFIEGSGSIVLFSSNIGDFRDPNNAAGETWTYGYVDKTDPQNPKYKIDTNTHIVLNTTTNFLGTSTDRKRYWTTKGGSNTNKKIDVHTTILHEFGHLLGLRHCFFYTNALMNPTYGIYYTQRYLDCRDGEHLVRLYCPTVCPNGNCNDYCPPGTAITITSFSAYGYLSSVVSEWSVSDNIKVSHFDLLRDDVSNGSGIFCEINTNIISSSSQIYTDNNVYTNISYAYRLKVTENNGNTVFSSTDNYNSPSSGSTAPSRPSKPKPFTVTDLSSDVGGKIMLYSSDKYTGTFHIYRKLSSESNLGYKRIKEVKYNTPTNLYYIDETTISNTTYVYTVREWKPDTYLHSRYFDYIIVTDVDNPPKAPTGVTVTKLGCSISISWNINFEPDIVGYNVYRGSTKIRSLTTSTNTTDKNCSNECYSITAVDIGSRESSKSTACTGIAVYSIDAGTPIPSPYLIQRDGFFVWGSTSDSTADYAQNKITYQIPLDPEKLYWIVTTTYALDDSRTQNLDIDGIPINQNYKVKNEVSTFDHIIPKATYKQDSSIDINISKVEGENAVISEIFIWEMDTDSDNNPNNVISKTLPLNFSLSQNYPNPFNPETTIEFALPKSEHISLSIYNLQGQLIQTLINEKKQPGYHSVQWNGTNNKNNPVSSGIYFYTIKAGNSFSQTRKMLLIK